MGKLGAGTAYRNCPAQFGGAIATWSRTRRRPVVIRPREIQFCQLGFGGETGVWIPTGHLVVEFQSPLELVPIELLSLQWSILQVVALSKTSDQSQNHSRQSLL